MPRICMVFLVRRELTRHAILWSQVFDSIKWPTVLVRKVNHAISRHICVDNYIILLKHLSNHIDFITNGFSWTNSTVDSRHRFPLIKLQHTSNNTGSLVVILGKRKENRTGQHQYQEHYCFKFVGTMVGTNKYNSK